jgi:hypothetical protein
VLINRFSSIVVSFGVWKTSPLFSATMSYAFLELALCTYSFSLNQEDLVYIFRGTLNPQKVRVYTQRFGRSRENKFTVQNMNPKKLDLG